LRLRVFKNNPKKILAAHKKIRKNFSASKKNQKTFFFQKFFSRSPPQIEIIPHVPKTLKTLTFSDVIAIGGNRRAFETVSLKNHPVIYVKKSDPQNAVKL
jgi:hypothetical protein